MARGRTNCLAIERCPLLRGAPCTGARESGLNRGRQRRNAGGILSLCLHSQEYLSESCVQKYDSERHPATHSAIDCNCTLDARHPAAQVITYIPGPRCQFLEFVLFRQLLFRVQPERSEQSTERRSCPR